jgi:hypothetical protein
MQILSMEGLQIDGFEHAKEFADLNMSFRDLQVHFDLKRNMQICFFHLMVNADFMNKCIYEGL